MNNLFRVTNPNFISYTTAMYCNSNIAFLIVQGCGSRDLVLVSRPIKTTFLRSWSGLGLGLPGLDNISVIVSPLAV